MRHREVVNSFKLYQNLEKLDPEERALTIHRILDGLAFTLMTTGKSTMDYRYKNTWSWSYRYTGPSGHEIRATARNFKP